MKWWPFGKKNDPAPQASATGTFSITDADRWVELFGGGATASGQVVTTETAMRCSAVFACVRLIAGAVSCSPALVYRRNGDQRQRAADHPMERVLRLRPNRFMTASTFWKLFMGHKLLAGNAYANIVRARSGQPVALMLLKPHNVSVYWAWEMGLDASLGVERNRLFYSVTFDDGATRVFDQDDMIHVPNIGGDGKKGLSTIQAMAQSVGLALAAEESSAEFFANGMQTEVSISYPKPLAPEAMERLREHIQNRYTGTGKRHKPLILTDGGEVKTLTMSAEDAQLLESRKFSVIDICRFFGVNPVMVGESEKTSSWGSGVEQMGRWFNTLTMNEHFTAIEQELEAKLFSDGYFAEFDETELTRGDTKTRHEAYRVARGSMQEPGYMTINEIRAAEGLPPVPGGDVLQRPEPVAGEGEANA